MSRTPHGLTVSDPVAVIIARRDGSVHCEGNAAFSKLPVEQQAAMLQSATPK